MQAAAITQGPTNQSVAVGATVSFSVQAVGAPAPSYQWSFNNLILAGATSSVLTLTNVQVSQAGTYSITVSNAYGSATNFATLNITNAPASSTNTVTTNTQAALQSAISAGGTITFGFNGTITLTNTIVITNNVALDGQSRAVVISGGNAVQLFYVNSNVTFSVTNLGLAYGSYIGQNGTNAANAQPPQNGYPGQGGAIYNNGGIVQLVGVSVYSNSVSGGMGGVPQAAVATNGFGGPGQGGALFINGGSLLLQGVNLFENSATGGTATSQGQPGLALGGVAQGGALFVSNGTAQVLNCIFNSNYCYTQVGGAVGQNGAEASGGAAFLGSGSIIFSNSLFTANEAIGSNAPNNISIQAAPGTAYGGAFGSASGAAVFSFCQVISNIAMGGNGYRYSGTGLADGGAVYNGASFLATDSTFSGNQALGGSGSNTNANGSGGGLFNTGNATIMRCTISSNLAVGGFAGSFGTPALAFPGGNGLGGGIYNLSLLALTNCTVALNSASGGAGDLPFGVPGGGSGGGIYNSNGTVTSMNITVATNGVVAGRGANYSGFVAGANVANSNGVLSVENSLIAYPGTNNNASGTITDAGYNISSDGSANFQSGTSYNYTDPLLQPLANNGGPTLTMALSSNSPAVDLGTAMGAPSTDQRGVLRPSGPGVDEGAYELLQGGSALFITQLQTNLLQISFSGQSNFTYVLQSSSLLSNWVSVETIGPLTSNAQVNLNVATNGSPTEFFRIVAPGGL